LGAFRRRAGVFAAVVFVGVLGDDFAGALAGRRAEDCGSGLAGAFTFAVAGVAVGVAVAFLARGFVGVVLLGVCLPMRELLVLAATGLLFGVLFGVRFGVAGVRLAPRDFAGAFEGVFGVVFFVP
jgi:hypothetical protein